MRALANFRADVHELSYESCFTVTRADARTNFHPDVDKLRYEAATRERVHWPRGPAPRSATACQSGFPSNQDTGVD